METTVLPIPTMLYATGEAAPADSNTLRRLPIQHSVRLPKHQWVMCYDKNRHFRDADKLFQLMIQSSKTLNMLVEEPVWFELDREDNTNYFKELLDNYIQQ
jgi:hypothetical protein